MDIIRFYTMASVEGRTFLPVKDIGIWAAETVGAYAALSVAQQLGLTEPYMALAQSLAHINIVSEALKDIPRLVDKPELLKPAAMGVGFVTGVVTDIVMSGDTLAHLNGKIRLTGTGNSTMNDGVKEIHRQCVDARIDQNSQDAVEPGAGLNGGAFIANQAIALGIHFGLPENLLTDFLTGYYVGRTLPTALVSAGVTQFAALKTGLLGFTGQPPVREDENPHEEACGWSGTQNMIKHWLKFSENYHAEKVRVLDAWNRIDETLNTAIWEPVMNVLAVPLSGFRFRIAHTFGRTPIPESH